MDPRCRRASVGVIRPLLDGTDWAGIRRSHGSTRNTISANAIPNSIFLRTGARKASSMTRSYVRIVTCRYWYWERFYRCLVVCITTGNMWTDKRKEKFSIWENTLCKYCSLVFIYIKSQGVCLLSSLASAAYTHDIEHTTLRKENSQQCKSSIHLTLASDVNWTVVYDGLESERYEIFVAWDVLCQLVLSSPQSWNINSKGGYSCRKQIFHGASNSPTYSSLLENSNCFDHKIFDLKESRELQLLGETRSTVLEIN